MNYPVPLGRGVVHFPDVYIVQRGKFENLRFSLKKLSPTKYLACLHRDSSFL